MMMMPRYDWKKHMTVGLYL